MGFFKQKMLNELEIRGFSQRTIQIYINCMKVFITFCNKSPERINSSDVNKFQVYLKKSNYSWSAFNQFVSAIKFFYRNVLKVNWKIEDIPYTKVKKRLPEILSRDEIKKMFASTKNIKHKAIFLTLYSTGMRLSELVNLEINDIDSKRMTIKIRQAKGNKDRHVMLSEKLLLLLREYWKMYKPEKYLFEGVKRGKKICPRTIQMLVTKMADNSLIKKKSLYTPYGIPLQPICLKMARI